MTAVVTDAVGTEPATVSVAVVTDGSRGEKCDSAFTAAVREGRGPYPVGRSALIASSSSSVRRGASPFSADGGCGCEGEGVAVAGAATVDRARSAQLICPVPLLPGVLVDDVAAAVPKPTPADASWCTAGGGNGGERGGEDITGWGAPLPFRLLTALLALLWPLVRERLALCAVDVGASGGVVGGCDGG